MTGGRRLDIHPAYSHVQLSEPERGSPPPKRIRFGYRGRRLSFANDGSIDVDLDAIETAQALGGELDAQTCCLLELADHVAADPGPEQAEDANRAMRLFATRPHLPPDPTVWDVIALSWIDPPPDWFTSIPPELPTAAVDRIADSGNAVALRHPNLSDDALGRAVAAHDPHVARNTRLSAAHFAELLPAFRPNPTSRHYGLAELLANPAMPPSLIKEILRGRSSRQRALIAVNPNLTADQRAACRGDLSSEVRAAACWNRSNSDSEAEPLAADPCDFVRQTWARSERARIAHATERLGRRPPRELDLYPIDLGPPFRLGHATFTTPQPVRRRRRSLSGENSPWQAYQEFASCFSRPTAEEAR